MLIWKVIAASPGITYGEIRERVEHDIPAGYACRRFERWSYRPKKYIGTDRSLPMYLRKARGYILAMALSDMKRNRNITSDGSGKGQRYTVARELHYMGNADAIDETGTKAAEHMAVAEALRKVERMLATPTAVQKYGRKNCEAIERLVRTLRARGSADT
jgi:hypothetical protein